MAAAMRAEGIDPYEKVQVDYFATVEDSRTVLPDGVSWVSHKQMNEGDRKRYLKAVNRDLKIQKGTGDAIMKVSAGEDRTALLKVAITGWNLVRGGAPLAFSPANLEALLNGPVHVLELIEKDVKKNNPWLFQDATVEDIDEEIERLQEMRQDIVDREAGNGGSVNS
jgi:hypothetical protein